MKFKAAFVTVLTALVVISTAITAQASDGESGWRYGNQCAIGSETRPAVAWRASKQVEVTPPGATYTLVYGTSTSGYRTQTNGGLMQGGYWELFAAYGDVVQSSTFGSCTTP